MEEPFGGGQKALAHLEMSQSKGALLLANSGGLQLDLQVFVNAW